MSTEANPTQEHLTAWIHAAAAGDRAAAQEVLRAVQDGVYRLALRMLGHPQDAEDAAQEILVIVLTHLGSFRGESAFTTWVWKIAARRLAEVKRGRRETDSFEELEERLQSLGQEPLSPESESEAAKPAKVFRFADIQDAHRLMESSQATGKIVVSLG